KLRGNTLFVPSPGHSIVYISNDFSPKKWTSGEYKAIPVRAQSNVIDALEIIHFGESEAHWKELPPQEADSLLARVVSWQDGDNLYSAGRDREFWSTDAPEGGPPSPKSLAEWMRFWSDPDAKCQEGHVRFRGGDLGSRAQITLDDFRLRPDSAGFRGGEDGKD